MIFYTHKYRELGTRNGVYNADDEEVDRPRGGMA